MFSKAVVTISVRDLDRSLDFYTRILGFHVVHRLEREIIHVAGPGMVIALRPRNHAMAALDTPHMHIGLMVVDLDEAREELEQRGVMFIGESIEMEPVKLAFFTDPDGTSLYLCQWKSWLKTRPVPTRYAYDLAVI